MKASKNIKESVNIDPKVVWKAFADVTTNRPSKSDIKTLFYKVTAKGVNVNWGDYSRLGSCTFGPKFFERLGCTQEEFITWLESQGVSPDRSVKKRPPKERPLYD